MAMKKYNEYLQVNPSFESVVDIAAVVAIRISGGSILSAMTWKS